jgi:tetratricopeptide (TPR) repeat protein
MMKIRPFKMAQTLLVVLGCGLGLSAVALGQSGMSPNPDGTSPAALTPQQQNQSNQRQQVDQAAVKALQAGQYDDAAADARQAIAMDASDILGPKVLAQALDAKGDTSGALSAYKALADPDDLIPYALLLLRQGNWAEALATYEKALPYIGEGNLLRADNNFSLDTPQPQALEAAIHVARGLTYNIGDIVTPHAQNDKALTEFQKATALAPDSALANYYVGYGLQRMGRRADAQAAFKKAAALDQSNGDVKAAAEAALAGR